MKKQFLALTLLFSIQISNTVIFSQEFRPNGTISFNDDKNKHILVISDKLTMGNSYPIEEPKYRLFSDLNAGSDSLKQNTDTKKKKKKSVALGVLFSALLPGAGEFYGEDYLKAGIFFAIEVAAWGTYIYFNNKGNNQTDSYQKYADTYWDVRTYGRWLKDEGFEDSGGINPDEPDLNVLMDQIRVCEQSNFSHTLPEYKSQQYYELIGKYQNFQAGWTNLAHRPTKAQGPYWYETYHDPVFTGYADERQKANDFYDYAKIGPITAIVNHILSAADAAWVISTYNKKIKLQTGFRMENRFSPYTLKIEQIPTFNLSVNF